MLQADFLPLTIVGDLFYKLLFSNVLVATHMQFESWILVECKMKYVSEELPSVWCKIKLIPDNPHNENLYNARVPELVRQKREHTSISLFGHAPSLN